MCWFWVRVPAALLKLKKHLYFSLEKYKCFFVDQTDRLKSKLELESKLEIVDPGSDFLDDFLRRNTILFQAVPFSNRHRAV